MQAFEQFRGFFSYAHHDVAVSSRLVKMLMELLPPVIEAHFTNVRFEIWQDTKLRTGDRWEQTIKDQLYKSDVLIVLLSPRWIGSEFCRREYQLFEQVEANYGGGHYVTPIQVRQLGEQEKHLSPEELAVYKSIRQRQYFQTLARDFLALSGDQRAVIIEKIADDVVGIIERRQVSRKSREGLMSPLKQPSFVRPIRNSQPTNPYRFDEVNLISNEEVVIDPPKLGERRSIYAQIDFLERFYIEGKKARIEFGVGRATLTIDNAGPGSIMPAYEDHRGDARHNARFIKLLHEDHDIVLSVDPQAGHRTLGELALPRTEEQNRFSHIGNATVEVDTKQMSAEVRVSLSSEGLHVYNDEVYNIVQTKRKQIEAIATVAASLRQYTIIDGQIRRAISISERE